MLCTHSERGEADGAGVQGRAWAAGASGGHEHQGRCRLCGIPAMISDLLDADSSLVTLSETVESRTAFWRSTVSADDLAELSC